MKTPHTLTAVVFLAFILGFGAFLLTDSARIYEEIRSSWQSADGGTVSRLDAVTNGFENALNASLRRGNLAVELYGGLLRLAGKRVSEDLAASDYSVARLDNGALTFVNLDHQVLPDNSPTVDEITHWAHTLAQADIPLLFIAYPKKTPRTNTGLPPWLADWPVLRMSALTKRLKQNGVNVLDLRDSFESMGDYSHLFYRTDHHWNVAGGFFAFQAICNTLRSDYGMTPDPFYEDKTNYHSTVLKEWFLGSQGKRVGTLFGGADDFEVITPAFDTSFTLSIPSQEIVRKGPMEDTILFSEWIEVKDYYNGNPYLYYSGGDFDLVIIENHQNLDGPSILLVRDSMACAITPFLALDCSTLTLVDTRFYTGDVAQLALDLEVDMVQVLRG